jgi:hypothetical protein
MAKTAGRSSLLHRRTKSKRPMLPASSEPSDRSDPNWLVTSANRMIRPCSRSARNKSWEGRQDEARHVPDTERCNCRGWYRYRQELSTSWATMSVARLYCVRNGRVGRSRPALPICLIGMEACVGAHHLCRKLRALGQDARQTCCCSARRFHDVPRCGVSPSKKPKGLTQTNTSDRPLQPRNYGAIGRRVCKSLRIARLAAAAARCLSVCPLTIEPSEKIFSSRNSSNLASAYSAAAITQ